MKYLLPSRTLDNFLDDPSTFNVADPNLLDGINAWFNSRGMKLPAESTIVEPVSIPIDDSNSTPRNPTFADLVKEQFILDEETAENVFDVTEEVVNNSKTKNFIDSAKNAMGNVGNATKNAMGNVGNATKNAMGNVGNATKNAVDVTGNALKNTGGSLGRIGKGVAIGGTAVVGGGLAAGGIYQMLPSGGQEFIQDVLPGESENARLAIERKRLREEQDRQWNRMRPYNLTPEEQMRMSQLQAQWAANQKMEYQSLAQVRQAQIQAMANQINAQLASMQNTNDMVQGIIGQRVY